MRKYVNIITISLSMLLLIAWYFMAVSLYFLVPVFIIYSIILIIGSSKIGLNYFVKSHNKGVTVKKEIALTFDDGPDLEVTPKILEILDAEKITATFFCVGEKVKSNPGLVAQIHNSGHILGNHTYYHSRFFDLFSSYRMINEINCTNNEIYKITGIKPRLFRPPFGVTNPLLKKALKSTAMTSIGWSLRSFDTVINEEGVLKKLISKTSKGDIVLFHDNIPGVISILKRYLKWLHENDFNVVSITKLLNIPAYEV